MTDSLIGQIEALKEEIYYVGGNPNLSATAAPVNAVIDKIIATIVRNHTPAGREGDVERFLGWIADLPHTTGALVSIKAEAKKLAAMSPVAGDAPEFPEDEPIEPKLLECPLQQLMDWYNHPNAVTYQRFTYFDALCRHVVWLEQQAATVPKPVSVKDCIKAAEMACEEEAMQRAAKTGYSVTTNSQETETVVKATLEKAGVKYVD